MSREPGHGGLGQAPTHFCRTEDFSDVVWLEKAMVSFCKKMKEAIKDKAEFIIRGSRWYRLEKSFMEETKCSASERKIGLKLVDSFRFSGF